MTPGTGPAPVRVPDPREVSRSSHQTPTPTETPTRTATARAASTRRTRWGGCAGPAGAVINGVQGGTGEAWVPAVAQGGANEVCVSAEAHGGAAPVSPEAQAERPDSSLGPCPAPEPELWPFQPFIANPPNHPTGQGFDRRAKNGHGPRSGRNRNRARAGS